MSKYLIKKYTTFEILDLNYAGRIDGWSKFVADALETLDDKEIVFALDDYLISQPMSKNNIDELPEGVVNAKLCECLESENKEYPVTTQFTLWNREYLISLLAQTTSPWDFEINGSRIFQDTDQKMVHWPILKYNTSSALSARWPGIDLKGLNVEDQREIQKL